jgi:hypothetical protein
MVFPKWVDGSDLKASLGWLVPSFFGSERSGKRRHERLLMGILKTGWSLSAGHREPAPVFPLFSIS